MKNEWKEGMKGNGATEWMIERKPFLLSSKHYHKTDGNMLQYFVHTHKLLNKGKTIERAKQASKQTRTKYKNKELPRLRTMLQEFIPTHRVLMTASQV